MSRRSADYIIIDTPGFDTNLTRLAHSLADTLVTPLNDSLIDIDVLAHVDPVSGEPRELSHYARLVQRARKERLAIDGRTIDWVLVSNRISMLSSRNMRLVQSGLEQIATRLGCRVADGIAERVIFRSLFPLGLTVFDELDEELLGGAPTTSHEGAQQEYRQLVHALNLPVSDAARARREWLVASAAPEPVRASDGLTPRTGPATGTGRRDRRGGIFAVVQISAADHAGQRRAAPRGVKTSRSISTRGCTTRRVRADRASTAPRRSIARRLSGRISTRRRSR